ncbi:hypothetical protein BS17DRAFT_763839 [Gyrodon lividus]|nr:hypothetical protein BS17DRAFT_763839 [Gyrodon lividus]
MRNKQTQFVATPMLTYTMDCFSSTRTTTTTLQLIDQITATPPPETNLGGGLFLEVSVKKNKLASAEVLVKKTEEKRVMYNELMQPQDDLRKPTHTKTQQRRPRNFALVASA